MKKEKIPNCKKERTFFNLFEVYTCNDCPLLRKDEEYIVGEKMMYIYHLDDGCILNKSLSKDDLINSKKMRVFLKDAILNQDSYLILWLDLFDPNKNEELFLNLMSFDQDVHIITF